MADSQKSGMNESARTPEHIDAVVDVTTAPIISQGVKKRQSSRSGLRARWAAFRLWRLRRPFWGSILMLLASLLMLYGPVVLLGSGLGLLPGSAVPIALLVGSLMLVMALAQLFAPAHALITGLIGIVLSIASLITGSFGGFGIGMLLGILGSVQGVAWKANARPLPMKRSAARNKVAIRRNPHPKN